MRIFTKKAFEFKNSEGGSVVTAPLAFHTAPDWVAEDNMFKWGAAYGDIEVIENKQEEKEIEKTVSDSESVTAEKVTTEEVTTEVTAETTVETTVEEQPTGKNKK